jgi:proteasome lid subunit RPN8/RPN11
MTIQISKAEISKIQAHGIETYPEECCGVLIGYSKPYIKVVEARRVSNTNIGSKNRRYNINPLEYMKIEQEVDNSELELLGIYHSHPDHPSKPSNFDLNYAFPNFSYIILSVTNGERGNLTSWRLNSSRKEFHEEIIKIN